MGRCGRREMKGGGEGSGKWGRRWWVVEGGRKEGGEKVGGNEAECGREREGW